MTKVQVLKDFNKNVKPKIIKLYGPTDKPAITEAWNNYTDFLCKAGYITSKQYDTWCNPF